MSLKNQNDALRAVLADIETAALRNTGPYARGLLSEQMRAIGVAAKQELLTDRSLSSDKTL